MPVQLSVIIATFNSAEQLPRVLTALEKQTLPRSCWELLIVDGGSTDSTLDLAKEYNARILSNPHREPVSAKHLAFFAAKSDFLLYLDHDEVLTHPRSLEQRLELLQRNDGVHAVITSGYQSPQGLHFVNTYINEFGDPFSFFLYRLSKDARFFLQNLKSRFPFTKDSSAYIFSFPLSDLPLIELCAGGALIRKSYFSMVVPKLKENKNLIPHLFYALAQDDGKVAVFPKDTLLHFSSDTVQGYLNKIRWRVKNNIYHKDKLGQSGFSGRAQFLTPQKRVLPYFYPFYAFLLIPVLWDTFWLMISRRDFRYWWHLPLTFFTAGLILFHYAGKFAGHRPALKTYDESTTV